MFTLRAFQNKHNEQTNIHVDVFDANHRLLLSHSDVAHLDWETCVFQIYPSDAHKQTFYMLPEGHALFLFVKNNDDDNDDYALLGQTRMRDEYIYFKPMQRPVYALWLIVAPNADQAKDIVTRNNYRHVDRSAD
jgi:hypothetical protein